MEKQMSFTDVEYEGRRKGTKREVFLQRMDALMPWEEWAKDIEVYYYRGERGRPRQPLEVMLRMLMLQCWFNLSDEGVEEAIYDSYAMKTFMGLNYSAGEQVPDSTTLCKFRQLLNEHDLQQALFARVQDVLAENGLRVSGGTIVDATIIDAPTSCKNKDHAPDPEMHKTKKNGKYRFGMRQHIGVDPVHGFVHSTVATPANVNEQKVAPALLRPDDKVVYGDAGYLKMERYVQDGVERQYYINRQMGTFRRHYGNGLSYEMELSLERRKTRTRRKVEFIFHILKDIFKWRKVRYRGIHKNDGYANLLLASVNLFMAGRMLAMVS